MASYRDRVLLQVSCAIAALGLLLTTGDDEIPRPRRRRARTVARCFELQQMRGYADLMIRNIYKESKQRQQKINKNNLESCDVC